MAHLPPLYPCVLCGSSHTYATGETHDDQNTSYILYHCVTCEAEFWIPCINPGAAWYEHDVRYATRNQDPILKPNHKHKAVLTHLTHAGRVLDVGCGVGNFLAYAKTLGWEGWGIDFDRDAIATAKETFGLQNVSVSDLQTFAKNHPKLRFDLITFFDVFEHLDNHNSFIYEVKQLLTTTGSVALSVPYRHAWRFLMRADVPPRHLTRWDERSLTTFLVRHGFSISLLCRGSASFYYLVLKLRFQYGRLFSFGLVGALKRRQGEQPTNTRASLSLRVQTLHRLAVVKDVVLFGLPAGILWLWLLPSRRRYTDLYVVARKS